MIWKTLAAAALCFVITLILGKLAIPMLHKLKYGQQVREDGPKSHLSKQGTPTMGGVFLLLGLLGVVVFDASSLMLWLAVAFALGFGLIGFVDDYIKIVKKRSLGLRAYQKMMAQLALAGLMALYAKNTIGSEVWIPFADKYIDFGIWFVPFMTFAVVGAVNACNLTDGLDGLLTGVMLVIMSALLIILFQIQKTGIFRAENINALSYFTGGLLGAMMGFLRYNVFPAKVFMGDTGSLALGGALAYVMICSNTVLLLPIMGGCMVMSVVSVIIQVASYKSTGKRVFRMAPLHHHFELSGLHETRVVAMYVGVTIGLCVLCLWAFI